MVSSVTNLKPVIASDIDEATTYRSVEAPTVVPNTEPVSVCALAELATNITSNSFVNTPITSMNNVPELVSRPSMADVLKASSEYKHKVGDTDKWVTVQYKKSIRNRFISNTGKATNEHNNKFIAAPITRVPLYISNVSRESKKEDIIEYI